ncbi:hypothetical protein [Cysteiniphilum litorale]|uniref:hypothetical protein n=1 Tax=Cysteiniphilum litorale TaxID=2056700 RepID=UPI003F882F66
MRFQNNSSYACKIEGRFDLGDHSTRTLEPNTFSEDLTTTEWSGNSIITCNNGQIITWLHTSGTGPSMDVDIYNNQTNQHPSSDSEEEINLNSVKYVLTIDHGSGCTGFITISNS